MSKNGYPIWDTSINPSKIKLPPGVDELILKDPECPSLFIRVGKYKNSWLLYKKYAGKAVKRVIGDCAAMSEVEARIRTMAALDSMINGESPRNIVKKRVAFKTIQEVFEAWHKSHVSINCRTADHIYDDFARYWMPISKYYAVDLKASDVLAWRADLYKNKGAATANKQMSQLKACLNWARSTEYVDLGKLPTEGIKPFQSQTKMQVLTPNTSKWHSFKTHMLKLPQVVQDIIVIGLTTGARRGNVISMEWKEINWETKTWVIPASKFKSKRQHTIYLIDEAFELLERRAKDAGDCPWVFPSQVDAKKHIVDFSEHWYALLKAAGIERNANGTRFVFHCLRHTFLSALGSQNANEFTIKKAAGHASIRSSERYVAVDEALVRDQISGALGQFF